MKKYISFFMLFGVLLLTGCKDATLLEGLNQHQANEVIALLQKNNIEVSKGAKTKEGFSITVKPSDFSSAVDLIKQHSLPSSSRKEVADLFPADSLVSSPRAEVARIYSAIEQRLEHTLNQMYGVVSSSVHVSYEVKNIDSSNKTAPVNISALLKYENDELNKESIITDAKRLLKNSFNNVEYENISVVLTRLDEPQQMSPVSQTSGGAFSSSSMLIIALLIIMVGVVTYVIAKSRQSRRIKDENVEPS
jgi:type III secretion protein J